MLGILNAPPVFIVANGGSMILRKGSRTNNTNNIHLFSLIDKRGPINCEIASRKL